MASALKTGRDALREALAGADEQLATRKPRPSSWSILECVEHPVVSERQSRRRGYDRGAGAARPGIRFGSLSEALLAFDSARAETVPFVEGFSGDLRSWITDHPRVAGPVNCYEILLMISVHPPRHAKQITEIRQAWAGTSGDACLRSPTIHQ